jgi:hypothetical protein
MGAQNVMVAEKPVEQQKITLAPELQNELKITSEVTAPKAIPEKPLKHMELPAFR